MRGHGDELDSNFNQLLKLRSEDDLRVSQWLKRKTDKYTLADIQNEILMTMSQNVLHTVTKLVQSAHFFSIMVDETTDGANEEQVVLCCRWVDSSMNAHEEFIGLHDHFTD